MADGAFAASFVGEEREEVGDEGVGQELREGVGTESAGAAGGEACDEGMEESYDSFIVASCA